jgi:hypothetical protein
MCGGPWCVGVTRFTIGNWEATNSSLVWIGDGFQDGFAPPAILPPPGAAAPLALFTVFNAQTGQNSSILAREVLIREMAQEVGIDIKPGSDPNCFNINGHGVIPVAILGSSEALACAFVAISSHNAIPRMSTETDIRTSSATSRMTAVPGSKAVTRRHLKVLCLMERASQAPTLSVLCPEQYSLSA